MTAAQRKELETNITRLETRIDSYTRIIEQTKKQAIYNIECGYRESAQFEEGQAFTLQYVTEDLQIILDSLKAIQNIN